MNLRATRWRYKPCKAVLLPGHFLDEVMKWQKRLQTIEAALTIWLEVQEKWVELEEVKHNTPMTKP